MSAARCDTLVGAGGLLLFPGLQPPLTSTLGMDSCFPTKILSQPPAVDSQPSCPGTFRENTSTVHYQSSLVRRGVGMALPEESRTGV